MCNVFTPANKRKNKTACEWFSSGGSIYFKLSRLLLCITITQQHPPSNSFLNSTWKYMFLSWNASWCHNSLCMGSDLFFFLFFLIPSPTQVKGFSITTRDSKWKQMPQLSYITAANRKHWKLLNVHLYLYQHAEFYFGEYRTKYTSPTLSSALI